MGLPLGFRGMKKTALGKRIENHLLHLPEVMPIYCFSVLLLDHRRV